jgi:hypothetical protein
MIASLYNNYTEHLYCQLNEMLKTYRAFYIFDKKRAAELLEDINNIRLAIALLAEQRQVFWSQIPVEGQAVNYKNSVNFTSDDIKSLISRLISTLAITTDMTLTQLGTREVLFTRERVAQQQLTSVTQYENAEADNPNGQVIPFDLPQEIFLDKNQSLELGVINQQTDAFIFVHGCNLKDDYSPNVDDIKKEIWSLDEFGRPNLPQPVLVPILFQFPSAAADTAAIAASGGKQIFSVKGGKSVILTDVSTTSRNSRITLIDNGRNQELCSQVESMGIAGFYTNQYTVYYPLPYWHMLRLTDRFEFRAINGSDITGETETANERQTMCFRGWTI